MRFDMRLLKGRSKLVPNSLTKILQGLGHEPIIEQPIVVAAKEFHYSPLFATSAEGNTPYSNNRKWHYWTQKQKFSYGAGPMTAAALEHHNVVAFPTQRKSQVKSLVESPVFENFARNVLTQVDEKSQKAPELRLTQQLQLQHALKNSFVPKMGSKRKNDEYQYQNSPKPTAPTPKPGM
jgi:hypothetical protein